MAKKTKDTQEKIESFDLQKTLDQTVLVDVIRHRIGQRRNESGEKIDTKGNKQKLRIVKYVFDSDNYRKAVSIIQDCYRWVGLRSLPGKCRYFRIPVNLLTDVIDHVDQENAKLKPVVEDFIAEMEELKKKEKEDLQDMFNEADYYTPTRLRAGFWIERELVELVTPSQNKVGADLATEAKRAAKEKYEAEMADVIFAFREQFQDLVGHLVEVLKPGSDGEKKRFQDSSITNILEWVELFSKQNVLGDKALAELAEKARKLLKDQDVKKIRKDDSFREQIAKATEALKAEADRAVELAPKRRIVFEEE